MSTGEVMTQVLDRSNHVTPAEPVDRRWTREEYYRLADGGYFAGQRVELIEGRILEMPPHGLPHAASVELLTRFVSKAFPPGYRLRIQLPFRAADGSDPEPDVAVVAGDPRDPANGHPTSAILIVEVSDTSLRHDRRKARLYAASNVADYWIVNLLDGTLEVHRNPLESPSDTTPPYASVRILTRDETIAPLGAPDATVKVADLLP
jgi:Uma2 family endonuclease